MRRRDEARDEPHRLVDALQGLAILPQKAGLVSSAGRGSRSSLISSVVQAERTVRLAGDPAPT